MCCNSIFTNHEQRYWINVKFPPYRNSKHYKQGTINIRTLCYPIRLNLWKCFLGETMSLLLTPFCKTINTVKCISIYLQIEIEDGCVLNYSLISEKLTKPCFRLCFISLQNLSIINNFCIIWKIYFKL